MANPFSEISYQQLLQLHRDEKNKSLKQLRELSSILISTLENSEEEGGIDKICKYFTFGFLKDIKDYYAQSIKDEKIGLETNQEMLEYARNKENP